MENLRVKDGQVMIYDSLPVMQLSHKEYKERLKTSFRGQFLCDQENSLQNNTKLKGDN